MSWELAITAVQSNVMEMESGADPEIRAAPRFHHVVWLWASALCAVGRWSASCTADQKLERCAAFANRASMVHEARR